MFSGNGLESSGVCHVAGGGTGMFLTRSAKIGPAAAQ